MRGRDHHRRTPQPSIRGSGEQSAIAAKNSDARQHQRGDHTSQPEESSRYPRADRDRCGRIGTDGSRRGPGERPRSVRVHELVPSSKQRLLRGGHGLSRNRRLGASSGLMAERRPGVSILDVTHADFGRLRLADYVPAHDVVQLDGWEYLDREWVGEAKGFTEWLRLESDPDVLRSIALDFQALPASVIAAVLTTLRLPLHSGMTAEKITAVLGQPVELSTFVPDRTTYDFNIDNVDAYAVGCTVRQDHGLIYLTVHPTPLPE